MGCVSSNLLNHDDDFPQIGGSTAFGHHIVKLTSTTYGLLTLDPPMTPPEKSTIATESKSLWSEPRQLKSEPEVINSWELMSGLDGESFRFTPLPKTPVKYKVFGGVNKENSDPNRRSPRKCLNDDVLKPLDPKSEKIFPLGGENSNPNRKNPINFVAGEVLKPIDLKLVEKFERICPPGGENRVVMYTTSLRGVRRTFEACNAVRAAVESYSVVICERDVSMDKGFREELVSLMAKRVRRNDDDAAPALPPRVFVKGMYIGGAEEVLRLVEEGLFGELIRGMPRKKTGGCGDGACDGCGGLFFLPCFRCNGSCKVVKGWGSASVVVRCMECNENGLVPCPICS
ncbi:hypothetical protein AALP_AA6G167600 [Arabis alpina]|uniref:Glutaredoxin domain-containing protein n=1 Tax=Arabis alpina TaxID=50452 RepID=A0A087GPQ6_ARAAL|nr:hypothetical protein AALP_AA6G167600 [Arabis alpina]